MICQIKRNSIWLIALLLAVIGCSAEAAPALAPTAAPAATQEIVLGKISDDPAEEISDWQPLADYLAANLSQFGIGAGKVKVAPDVETMAGWLATGQVDLFFDNPYSALTVSDQSRGQILVRRVKTDAEEKHAVIFTTAESGITSLDQLRGRLIAIEEPESASGFMLPVAYLVEAGLKPAHKTSLDAAVAADEVGYLFSLDDNNTALWVLSGKVAAGSVDNETFAEVKETNPTGLIILAETEPITRDQLGVISSKTDSTVTEAAKTLLLNLAGHAEAQAILPDETARFEAAYAEDVHLARIRYLYDLVADQ